MLPELSIGYLAGKAGVNVETIRYYQRRGLLLEPDKPESGHRRYPPELMKRVRFIKRTQALGFTLEEIAGLLHLDEARACAETRELAARKREMIEAKLADLSAMRKALSKLMMRSLGALGALPALCAFTSRPSLRAQWLSMPSDSTLRAELWVQRMTTCVVMNANRQR
jgi:MerR family transcriptional regulator, mercuric resistance operon regulatory protein